MEPPRTADDLRGDITALKVIIDSLLDNGLGDDDVTLLAASRLLAERKAELEALAGDGRPGG
jgi:hypothetical protein